MNPEWNAKRLSIVRTRMPARFADARTTDPRCEPWLTAVLAGTGGTLMLTGSVGAGKTHLAWGLWPELISRGWAGLWRATTEAAYLDGQFRKDPDFTGLGCRNADVLLLDDLGAANLSDWSRSVIGDLIDHRWAQRKATVVTTNHGNDLAQRIGQRSASRIGDEMLLIPVTGKDRRG